MGFGVYEACLAGLKKVSVILVDRKKSVIRSFLLNAGRPGQSESFTDRYLLENLSALNCPVAPLGIESDAHSPPFIIFPKSTICPT